MVSIEVIYENGVFRPLDPVTLPEGVRAEVLIAEETFTTKDSTPLVGEELVALLDEIATLPYVPHPDGRTDISVRHDDILYSKEGSLP